MTAPAGIARPVGLVLCAIASVQFGAALARTLFDDLGPGGTVLLRLAFATLLLAALWRPALRGRRRGDLGLVVLFGITLAGMNLSFYEALARIPLGIAVTFEFAGPLGLALVQSRRARDFLWVALAGGGILLLSEGIGEGGLDPAGVGFALLAGVFWAGYILVSARAGQTFEGAGALTLAMGVGAVAVSPAGVADGGEALLEPGLLAMGAAVALLSSAIPYSCELEALRSLPTRVFGVLMSLEPAVAALAGFVVLGQDLALRQLAAIALVVAASAGAARSARAAPPPEA